MEKVILDVSPEGVTKLSVEGVSGKGCKELTADLEKALGETSNVVETAEYRLAEKRSVKRQ